MPTILGANTLSSDYEVANSLRFDDGSSDYLNRTPSSAGNRRTFTFSTWVKRGNLGDKIIFSANTQSTSDGYFAIYFSSDAIRVRIYESSAKDVVTSMVFTDVSAWYHIVVAVDTTQGTAANRVKIYVNGSEAAKASGSYVSEDFDTSVNNTVMQHVGVGRNSGGSLENYFDGYLAETVLIDGTALDQTSFGEFDEDSPTIWKPKNVSGLTFGTNGFYLDFENSSSLGADVSGNGNNFTVNNLTSADQSTDTCTNNFCTLNPLYNHDGSYTLSEGNTQFLGTGGNDHTLGTLGVQGSGKWYFEVEFDTNKEACYAGFADSDLANNLASDAAGVTTFIGMYRDDETLNIGGSSEGAYTSVANGDIFGFAMNLDASSGSRTVIIQKNGSTIDTITIPTANEDNIFIPIVGDTSSSDGLLKCNFGGTPNPTPSSGVADANGHGSFEYNPTISGVDYLALCTKNLAEFG